MAVGFGFCGIPDLLIEAIRETGVTGLTVISDNVGGNDGDTNSDSASPRFAPRSDRSPNASGLRLKR